MRKIIGVKFCHIGKYAYLCKPLRLWPSYQRPKVYIQQPNKTFYRNEKGIHPSNYREVVFKDMSNDEIFITRSTVATKETIDVDGTTYPLVKLEITSSSHPFFTGKQKLVDTAGRVDKFMSRYGNRNKK